MASSSSRSWQTDVVKHSRAASLAGAGRRGDASGYFGCRNGDGTFSPERFAKTASEPQIKMIEIKLGQGAKPAHGGILPGSKAPPQALSPAPLIETPKSSPNRDRCHSQLTAPRLAPLAASQKLGVIQGA